jgi:acetylornithine deacetylase/succinyl-diaminopimelate desuccinylase-like protein
MNPAARRPFSAASGSAVYANDGALDSRGVDETWQAELGEFLRIPSVSAEAAHAGDVRRAGEWVCDFVRAAGGSAELAPLGEGFLALGELRASSGAEDAPTVLVYGHFDVQPPAPLELWESDPFELAVRDGWAYARGIADDKGQLYLLLKAAADLARQGALPLNVRVACDGEEEIGGHTIVDFLAAEERPEDVCVIFDAGFLGPGLPAFCIATRGLVSLEIVVTASERDLHSGLYGGVALNAIHVLVDALTTLFARDGRLPEPLRRGIVPPTEEEVAAWRELPPGEEELTGQGARPLDPRAAEEFYLRTWAEPSLDVNGILGGKPGLRNTTISARASAELSIRVVPEQDVTTIAAAAERMLREALPEGAELEVRSVGVPPGLIRPEEPAVQLGLDAFERALGVRPLLVRSGGSIPIVPALAARGTPTILTGFSLPDSNIHSPNERLPVEHFPLGLAAARELFGALAKL